MEENLYLHHENVIVFPVGKHILPSRGLETNKHHLKTTTRLHENHPHPHHHLLRHPHHHSHLRSNISAIAVAASADIALLNYSSRLGSQLVIVEARVCVTTM